MTGASTAGRMTLATRLCHLTAWPPAAASIAPITPPISACDELDGIPKNQVSRFHTIAPVRPAATTVSVTSLVSTRPLAIVAATARDRNAPIRLSTPDRATAIRGRSAPVAIVVAIALPVSWNPLVKSKARAVITTRPSTTSLPTSSESRPANSVSRLRKQRPTDIRLPFDFRSPSGHLIDGWWQLVSRPPVQKQQREQQRHRTVPDLGAPRRPRRPGPGRRNGRSWTTRGMGEPVSLSAGCWREWHAGGSVGGLPRT